MRIAVSKRFAWMIVLALSAALGASAAAVAQPQAGNAPPNALQGFSQNRDQPIKIDAASLEVRDKDKTATFSGNVQLVQGDTVLNCNSMVVFYNTDGKGAGAKEGAGAKNGAGAKDSASAKDGTDAKSIRRIEVLGNVVVTQKDQKATADNGFFDMKSNTITLVGNVVISQGPNVVKGDRLSVDLTTSVSRVECAKSGQCRVQALLQPGSGKEGGIGSPKDLMMKPKSSSQPGL
jgi:lipopolysaccharide export system protein LptA